MFNFTTMISERVYKHCQDRLHIASSKVGRYHALIEFAIEMLGHPSEIIRINAAEHISKRMTQITDESEQKLEEIRDYHNNLISQL